MIEPLFTAIMLGATASMAKVGGDKFVAVVRSDISPVAEVIACGSVDENSGGVEDRIT
jgi:hypothetical protein